MLQQAPKNTRYASVWTNQEYIVTVPSHWTLAYLTKMIMNAKFANFITHEGRSVVLFTDQISGLSMLSHTEEDEDSMDELIKSGNTSLDGVENVDKSEVH